jgi:hypothetical protein
MQGTNNVSLKAQRGVTLVGLIVVIGLLIFLGMFAMKVGPYFMEYLNAKNAIEVVKKTEGTAQQQRYAFTKNADISNISSISGQDLILYKVNGQTEVAFDYEARIQLLSNAALLIRFSATTDKSGVIPPKPEVTIN